MNVSYAFEIYDVNWRRIWLCNRVFLIVGHSKTRSVKTEHIPTDLPKNLYSYNLYLLGFKFGINK